MENFPSRDLPDAVSPESWMPERSKGRIRASGSAALIASCLLAATGYGQSPGDMVITQRTPPIRPGPFIACSGGYEYELALNADGSLRVWGGSPFAVVPTGPFVAVDATPGTPDVWALLLRDDGSIAFWGYAPGYEHIWQNIPEGPFVAVAAGGSKALALRPDGTLVQWGDPAMPPAPKGKFVAISSGGPNVAIRDDGRLVAWGIGNNHGQLDPPEGEFVAVAASNWWGVAIRKDGTLAAWGRDIYGILNVPSGTFVQVDASPFSGIALRTDGTVVGWGTAPVTPLYGSYQSISVGEYRYMGILGPNSCYVNCNGSSTPPVLNVDDFVCFQQRFAAGEPSANCDGSTTPPILNVDDFVCFQQRFASGCP